MKKTYIVCNCPKTAADTEFMHAYLQVQGWNQERKIMKKNPKISLGLNHELGLVDQDIGRAIHFSQFNDFKK